MSTRPEMDASALRGVRVIIVEDEFVIARSLEYLLRAFDCQVTGMAGTVSAALELVAQQPFDIAILDISLRGATVAPVAERLLARGDRFVFLTGYGDLTLLPDHLRAYPHLEKPIDPDRLLLALHDALHSPCEPERSP